MRIALVASALLMIAPASALQAKIYDLDFKGTIYDGKSQGALGPQGTSLDGVDLDLVFAFNYPTPGADIQEATDGNFLDYYGGSTYLNTSPLQATLYIEGKKFGFDADYSGSHFQETSDQGYNHIEDQVTDYDGSYAMAAVSAPIGNLITRVADPTSIRSVTASGPDNFGYFDLPDRSSGEFNVSSFTFSIPGMRGALPEPSIWIMMIMGFGLIGWVLRRDRTGHIALRPA